jgi:uncharacterized protein YdhG (YjbR/CyaY superfamily)
LEQVRATIDAAPPAAREKTSYQIVAFELDGKNLVHSAGWKNRISMYPIPSGSEAFQKIAPYIAGKGTLQFPLDKPLPLNLIRRIVKYRVADDEKNSKVKASKK